MKYLTTTLLATTALVAFVHAAQAQNLSYVGIIGQGINGTNDPGTGEGSMTALGLEAGLVYALNGQSRIVVEGRYLDWTSEDDTGAGNLLFDEPGTELEVALHYLRDSGSLTYGGFLQVGAAESVENDPSETYKHYAVGLEGTYRINPAYTVYGQIGIADTFDDDNLDSFGYNEGNFARLGAAYTGFANTQLFLDVQAGSSENYEDAGESGAFQRIALGGETRFGSGSNWAATYEISQAKYDAETDSNIVEVTTVGLGMRYYFGQTQSGDFMDAGAIGTPDIMSRASLFTDFLD